MFGSNLKLFALLLMLSYINLFGTTLPLIPSDSLNKINEQGGFLEFKKENILMYSNSIKNYDTLLLKNYTGLPLKAMQFKIKIENGNGIVKIKSVSRGLSLSSALYLFDYQIYNGIIDEAGKSYDMVSIVFLGNGWNALEAANEYHIATIEYEIGEINPNVENVVNVKLIDVIGATANPVMDALIKADKVETISIASYQPPIKDENIYLHQNYPNPFNPSTKITYTLPVGADNQLIPVTLKIYDILGNEAATLVNEEQPAGVYEVKFSASNFTSGVYIYQLRTSTFVESNKMLILK